jgi:thiamine pyrophosphokinase
MSLGVRPDVVIGDLDSLPNDLRSELEGGGVELLTYPAHKDETDLELALLHAVNLGALHITVVGARGGRIDHELANYLLLAHPRLEGVDARIVSGDQEVTLVRRRASFHGRPGDLLSLLPVAGDACGVTTSGLEYPLNDGTLVFGPARGVSNVFVEANSSVCLRSGMLLAVHTRLRGFRQVRE